VSPLTRVAGWVPEFNLWVGVEMRLTDSPVKFGKMRGVSLIEVLVAMVVMLFGLLALAGLMARTHTAEFESYQRKQVVIMLEDIVGRITANRDAASCYAFAASGSGTPYLGSGKTASPACIVGTGTPVLPTTEQAAQAVADLNEWSALLEGGTEVINPGNSEKKLGGALDARGCIMPGTSLAGQYDEYRVSIAWRGASSLNLPADDSNCARGSYGSDDGVRRVISTTVRIPVLN
jgi:type IV pilus assembly protein PilV